MANVIINDTHLNNIASAIREKNGKTTKYKPAEMATAISAIETGSGSSEWQPQTDWWDIDSILENDTEDYAGKIICLLSDSNLKTTIYGWNADKIVTSDGSIYTNTSSSISHTWDTSKDKECSFGYKTRYIIYYFTSGTNEGTHNYKKISDETLYCIFKNMNITITNQNYGNSVFAGKNLLQYIKFINTHFAYAPSFYKCFSLEGFVGLDFDEINCDRLFDSCGCLDETYINNVVQQLGTYTSLANFLNGCNCLKNLILPDTSHVRTFGSCFPSKSLVTINKLDLESATNIGGMFYQNTSLVSINEVSNIKITGIPFGQCINLNHDTLVRILNALYDYAAEGSADTYTLTLGTTNLAKLSDEEKAIATNKGWTLN